MSTSPQATDEALEESPDIPSVLPAESTEQISNNINPQPGQTLPEEHVVNPHIGYACLLQDIRSSIPILATDLLAILVAWATAYGICHVTGVQAAPGIRSLAALMFAIPVGFVLLRLYPAIGFHPAKEIQNVVVGISLIFIGLFVTVLYTDYPLTVFAHRTIHFLMTILIVPVFRMATRSICSHSTWWRQPTLVLGINSEEAQKVASWIEKQWFLGIRPVTSPKSESWLNLPTRVAVTPDAEFLANYEGDIAWVYPRVIYLPRTVLDFPSLGYCFDASSSTNTQSQNMLCSPFQQAAKRLLDVSLIMLSFPVFFPVMAAVALAVKLTSPGPVFYRQQRLRRNGVHFGAWKFRTMADNAEQLLAEALRSDPQLQAEWDRDRKLKHDPRVTRIGRVLRKTSLDELPQLFNVFCGQMSLVGPRPLPVEDFSKYESEYRESILRRTGRSQYARVTPGLTGLWQVSGRNNTTYRERIELDEFYVRNWSIWLDFFILFRTVKTVAFREGAY